MPCPTRSNRRDPRSRRLMAASMVVLALALGVGATACGSSGNRARSGPTLPQRSTTTTVGRLDHHPATSHPTSTTTTAEDHHHLVETTTSTTDPPTSTSTSRATTTTEPRTHHRGADDHHRSRALDLHLDIGGHHHGGARHGAREREEGTVAGHRPGGRPAGAAGSGCPATPFQPGPLVVPGRHPGTRRPGPGRPGPSRSGRRRSVPAGGPLERARATRPGPGHDHRGRARPTPPTRRAATRLDGLGRSSDQYLASIRNARALRIGPPAPTAEQLAFADAEAGQRLAVVADQLDQLSQLAAPHRKASAS